MELSVPKASASLALLFLVICTVDAMNYLAFPRMGRSVLSNEVKRDEMPWNMIFPRKRAMLPTNLILPRKREMTVDKLGYLAFPRMGRSQTKEGSDAAGSEDCCGIGLKSEFSVSEDGKELLHNVCTASVPECCEGLREMTDQKPTGEVYSMCVPDVVKLYPSSLNKLKRLLAK